MLDITTQESAVYQDWIRRFAVNEGFVANLHNSEVIDSWLDSHNRNYSYDSLNAALAANRSRLDGVLTLEQKQERARQQHIADHNNAVAAAWLRDECPTGLLVNGDLAPSSMDKVILFIQRHFPGAETVTAAMLNEAVKTLDAALDWFSSKPEDHELRNQPAPPSRKLSRQAKIDAGLEIESDPRNHSNDSELQDPKVTLKKVFEKATKGVESSDQIAAENLRVTTITGKYDHGFNARLRETFARNPDGSTNWKITREKREQACTEYERRRNRDHGQRG